MAGSSTFRVVVVGIDGSKRSDYALQLGIEMCKGRDAVVHVVHVREPQDEHKVDSLYAFKAYWADLEQSRKERSRQILGRAMAMCQAENVLVKEVLREGDAREELCRYCEEVKANILIVGTRSLSALKSLVLGSVGHYCTMHASCSVLIARQPPHSNVEESGKEPQQQQQQQEQKIPLEEQKCLLPQQVRKLMM
eukprot:TRINITY_DN1123_c0_g1_i11.p1 TRINITY_DN1123_c0_g1~~TRINITY_DN1123_c0_g1_i11.p1  ORF type:complete len:194 (+),score=43.48 TRINITY_DN1123_c0_g1_i11:281-862(+)